MKLLTKINRNYLVLLIVALTALAAGGFLVLKAVISSEARENLLSRELLIRKQIIDRGTVPDFYPLVEVKRLDQPSDQTPVFKKVIIWDELENEPEPFLEYSSTITVNGQDYFIRLRQSVLETKDLALIVSVWLLVLLLLVFAASYGISRKMNRSLWQDFENNLKRIEQFDLIANRGILLSPSPIEEFDRLNRVLNTMSRRIAEDYHALKEFTENASHEIQTPLSIALLQLDEMLQLDLSEDLFIKIHSVIQALKRLSSLNQSLILLTKIENRQFVSSNSLSITAIIEQKIAEFAPLFDAKNLTIQLEQNAEFFYSIHESLAFILVSNLLSNATNHNIPQGIIKINIDASGFTISNTGNETFLTNETIFQRFIKGETGSNGLGLAIVKKICDTHNLDIRYEKTSLHCFHIQQKIKPQNTTGSAADHFAPAP